ncbi:hypothetical protein LTR86_004570 [Recurvomyces mirabilis]|nr:hypothetical protein LTR86_004570 [Recurvomyces mirabilis]
MQSFNKPVTGALRKSLAERTSNVIMASEQKISVGSCMYPYQLQQTLAPVTAKAEASAVKQTIDAFNKQLSAAVPRGEPIILSVDAAAETMNSEAWQQLCQHSAKHGSFKASGMNDIKHGPSFPLKYAEDDHLSAQRTMHLKEHLKTLYLCTITIRDMGSSKTYSTGTQLHSLLDIQSGKMKVQFIGVMNRLNRGLNEEASHNSAIFRFGLVLPIYATSADFFQALPLSSGSSPASSTKYAWEVVTTKATTVSPAKQICHLKVKSKPDSKYVTPRPRESAKSSRTSSTARDQHGT